MKSCVIYILCFVFVISACQKDAVSTKIRVRFENQTQWNFTNVLIAPTNWRANSRYVSLGNLAIGETSKFMECDTLYRQVNQVELGSFSANISANERMAVVQASGPMNPSYSMLSPGDYTVIITNGYYMSGSVRTTYLDFSLQ
jgi:hypothetical protein